MKGGSSGGEGTRGGTASAENSSSSISLWLADPAGDERVNDETVTFFVLEFNESTLRGSEGAWEGV